MRFAPRRIEGPTGGSIGIVKRASFVPEQLRWREYAASRRMKSRTESIIDPSVDRQAYGTGLQARLSEAFKDQFTSVQVSGIGIEGEGLKFETEALYGMVNSAIQWGGVGNLQFTPGGIEDTSSRSKGGSVRELHGLLARGETFGRNWDKAEIKGRDFVAAVKNLIGTEDGTYAIIGPTADFTGTKRTDGKLGAGEAGVFTMITKRGSRYRIYDGSTITTAVLQDGQWKLETERLSVKPHTDFFAITKPFDKAIIANLGVLKLQENGNSEGAPIVVRARVKAGQEVKLADLTRALTGEDGEVVLPRGSMFVMAQSLDETADFQVNRNVICAMPQALTETPWQAQFKETPDHPGFSALGEDLAVSGAETYVGAGTFDTDLAYSRGGHVHGINAASGGHLNSIKAGTSDLEVAVVMYPSKISSYTETAPVGK